MFARMASKVRFSCYGLNVNIVSQYHAFIEWTITVSGLGDKALHFNAGLAILFGARIAVRRRLSTMTPLAVVIVAELLNEVLDRAFWGSWRWHDTAADIFNTLFWPVLISWAACAREVWPGILGATEAQKSDSES